MNNRENKLYGIYDMEAEIQSEMDRLRAEGFIEEDMYIVSKQDNQYSMHRGFSDYDNTLTSYDATDAARTEEEQLHVDKKRVQTGEADVEKYVVED